MRKQINKLEFMNEKNITCSQKDIVFLRGLAKYLGIIFAMYICLKMFYIQNLENSQNPITGKQARQ